MTLVQFNSAIDDYEEDDPTCDYCGNTMFWADCYQCGGAGGVDGDELMQEDPLWYSEDDWETCHVCDGDGGFWVCEYTEEHHIERDGRERQSN